MHLSKAVDYLVEVFLQPEVCLLLVQLEVEVEVDTQEEELCCSSRL